jgi:hypothetical protein
LFSVLGKIGVTNSDKFSGLVKTIVECATGFGESAVPQEIAPELTSFVVPWSLVLACSAKCSVKETYMGLASISHIIRAKCLTTKKQDWAVLQALNIIKDTCPIGDVFHKETIDCVMLLSYVGKDTVDNIMKWNTGKWAKKGNLNQFSGKIDAFDDNLVKVKAAKPPKAPKSPKKAKAPKAAKAPKKKKSKPVSAEKEKEEKEIEKEKEDTEVKDVKEDKMEEAQKAELMVEVAKADEVAKVEEAAGTEGAEKTEKEEKKSEKTSLLMSPKMPKWKMPKFGRSAKKSAKADSVDPSAAAVVADGSAESKEVMVDENGVQMNTLNSASSEDAKTAIIGSKDEVEVVAPMTPVVDGAGTSNPIITAAAAAAGEAATPSSESKEGVKEGLKEEEKGEAKGAEEGKEDATASPATPSRKLALTWSPFKPRQVNRQNSEGAKTSQKSTRRLLARNSTNPENKTSSKGDASVGDESVAEGLAEGQATSSGEQKVETTSDEWKKGLEAGAGVDDVAAAANRPISAASVGAISVSVDIDAKKTETAGGAVSFTNPPAGNNATATPTKDADGVAAGIAESKDGKAEGGQGT